MPKANKLTLAAIFLALCVLVPILFHSFGLGSIFLPLLLPIALGAFFLPVPYALLVGVMGPMISALLTGMPPLSPPIAQVMMLEGGVLGGVTALLNSRFRLGVFLPLLAGIVLSRGMLLIFYLLLAPVLGLPARPFSAAAVISGFPGMLLQLILVPIIVQRLTRQKIIGR